MLTLYHGDTSVCSQKVRLALTEKQLEWTGEFIDLDKGVQFDPEYMKLNPNAVAPTLIHDGKVMVHGTPEEVKRHPEVRRKYLGDFDSHSAQTGGPPEPHFPTKTARNRRRRASIHEQDTLDANGR